MKKQHYMTKAERIRLEAYIQAGRPVSWIADHMGFSRQTIYNEIRRGSTGGSYSATSGQAAQTGNSKKKGCPQKLDISSRLAKYLEAKMLGLQPDGTIDKRKRYSPAAALQAAHNDGLQPNISLTTLYNYIDQGKFPKIKNTDLWEKAKRKPRKKPKKPRIAHKNLPSIENRSKEINTRQDYGHWEMDLIIGQQRSKPCLLTLTERTTREEIIIRLPDKRAKTIRKAFNRLERTMPDFESKFRSITTDNGSEFMEYQKLKKSIKHKGDRFQLYYCHSFAAWEKGTNENHNRIIRRWFPKGTDFTNVTQKEVQACQDWMNNYPRKILDWKTPLQLTAVLAPRAAKASARGAPQKINSFLPVSEPAARRPLNTIHIYLLSILLELQNLLFTHHLPFLHGMFQIPNTGKSVISCKIAIAYKPAGPGKGTDQLSITGVLKFPCVKHIQTLKSPDLITFGNIACNLPKKSIHVAETLSRIVQTDVIVSARQDSIQKQRVNIGFKVPAVHLHRELIPKHQSNCQSIVKVIIILFPFRIQNNLFQRDKVFIRNAEGHI